MTIEDAKTGLAWLDRAHEQARGYTPAHALPPLPGEHIEAVDLDVGTQDGRVVVIHGRVYVFEPTRVIFVEVPTSLSALDRDAASSMLQHAVRNRLVRMSDILLSAVERGFEVKGYGDRAVEVAS